MSMQDYRKARSKGARCNLSYSVRQVAFGIHHTVNNLTLELTIYSVWDQKTTAIIRFIRFIDNLSFRSYDTPRFFSKLSLFAIYHYEVTRDDSCVLGFKSKSSNCNRYHSKVMATKNDTS